MCSELDYVDQTSRLLFLKYFDDFEKDKKTSAELTGKEYKEIISKQYRWDVWAMPKGKDGKHDHHKALSGDDLTDFVKLQKTKADSENSWTLKITDVDEKTFDLSAKNPNKKEEAALRDPEKILKEMKQLDKESEDILISIFELI